MSNAFHTFWAAGYKRLVPITVSGGPIHPEGSFRDRPKAMGKAPGILRDGKWIGLNWLKLEATEASLDYWAGMGAGVGIRTGAGLIAVDVDTLNEDLATKVYKLACASLGVAPVRFGHRPKHLLLYRVTEDMPYQRVRFDDGLEHKKGSSAAVELLSEGRQFVAYGIHPVTGKPYTWPKNLPSIDLLPVVTPEQVNAFFQRLGQELPAAKRDEQSASAKDAPDQATLKGDPETVRRALQALPNDERFHGRVEWLNVCYALKGALPDDPDTALELWLEWCARWTEDENDPLIVEADFNRAKGPYRVGAPYLYDLAEKHAASFSRFDDWFEAVPVAAPNLFEQPATATATAVEQPALEPIKFFDPSKHWAGKTPPVREWEVKNLIPRGTLALVYGDGGVGKTLLMHQYAICAAAGRPWLGQETRQAKVMAVFCEDSEDELHRRHVAIMRAMGLNDEDLGGRLRMVSRAGEDNLLATAPRSGAMQKTQFWHQLAVEVTTWRPDVTILDTLADIFGGSEIDRAQVNQFMKHVLGGLVKELGGTLIALGHPSVAGKAEGRSGSTAWSNAARSRLFLRYPKGKEVGNDRELEGMKSNYAPKGTRIIVRWERGAFVAMAESKPGIDEATLTSSPALPSIADTAERAVLLALAEAERERRALNLSPQSRAYAPRVLKQLCPDSMDVVRVEDIERAVLALERRGAIKPTTFRDGSRNVVNGWAVVAPDQWPSVFD